MSNSTHKVEVVRVKLEPHPNADSLSIVRVFTGYQVVVRTDEWRDGDLAAYVPPDSVVPLDRPEFSWLDKPRVKVRRFRGAWSMGLLVPAPPTALEGDDVAATLGVTHYVPPQRGASQPKLYGSPAEPAPTVNPPVYDIDSLRRYADIFSEGERVIVTEKIHGANARYTHEPRGCFERRSSLRRTPRGLKGKLTIRLGARTVEYRPGFGISFGKARFPAMRVGSRKLWKRPGEQDVWWNALEKRPEIAKLCEAYPGFVLFGEVYGNVQDLDYGLGNDIDFVAFDLMTPERQFLNHSHFSRIVDSFGIPQVPVLYRGPFNLEHILELAEGRNVLGAGAGSTHAREGVVVRPLDERWHPRLGRVILKAVGNGYLERAA